MFNSLIFCIYIMFNYFL